MFSYRQTKWIFLYIHTYWLNYLIAAAWIWFLTTGKWIHGEILFCGFWRKKSHGFAEWFQRNQWRFCKCCCSKNCWRCLTFEAICQQIQIRIHIFFCIYTVFMKIHTKYIHYISNLFSIYIAYKIYLCEKKLISFNELYKISFHVIHTQTYCNRQYKKVVTNIETKRK